MRTYGLKTIWKKHSAELNNWMEQENIARAARKNAPHTYWAIRLKHKANS